MFKEFSDVENDLKQAGSHKAELLAVSFQLLAPCFAGPVRKEACRPNTFFLSSVSNAVQFISPMKTTDVHKEKMQGISYSGQVLTVHVTDV